MKKMFRGYAKYHSMYNVFPLVAITWF